MEMDGWMDGQKVVGMMKKQKESQPDGSASEFGSCLGLAPWSPAIGCLLCLFTVFVLFALFSEGPKEKVIFTSSSNST